jgi:hypothetical protein
MVKLQCISLWSNCAGLAERFCPATRADERGTGAGLERTEIASEAFRPDREAQNLFTICRQLRQMRVAERRKRSVDTNT